VPAAPAGHWPHKVAALAQTLPQTNMAALGLGLLALAVMVILPRFTSKIPSAIVGIVVATLAAVGLSHMGVEVETIGSRFSYTDAQGILQHGIPPFPPTPHIPGLSDNPVYALPTLTELSAWLVPSLVIAILAGLESLLSATVADSMAGTRHEPNAELNGIGIGNILSGLFLGIPATGAIARTATNINAGAISPVAAMTHAVLLLIYMLVLAPVIAYVPMTALSALLLVTAWRMSHARHFLHLLRTAPKADRAVAIVCFVMTVMIDMVAGVLSGVVLAIVLFLKRMMDATSVSLHHAADNRTEYHLPEGTMLLRFDGPLFFGTANKAFDLRPEMQTKDIEHIVLDMTNVPAIDVTALNLLEDELRGMCAKGRRVTVCASEEVAKRIQRRLHADILAKIRIVPDTKTGLTY